MNKNTSYLIWCCAVWGRCRVPGKAPTIIRSVFTSETLAEAEQQREHINVAHRNRHGLSLCQIELRRFDRCLWILWLPASIYPLTSWESTLWTQYVSNRWKKVVIDIVYTKRNSFGWSEWSAGPDDENQHNKSNPFYLLQLSIRRSLYIRALICRLRCGQLWLLWYQWSLSCLSRALSPMPFFFFFSLRPGYLFESSMFWFWLLHTFYGKSRLWSMWTHFTGIDIHPLMLKCNSLELRALNKGIFLWPFGEPFIWVLDLSF